MKLLLDTHIFLWYLNADPQLPAAFIAAIRNPTNAVFVSAASIWEVVIKNSLGKLPLPSPPADFLPQQREAHGFISLAVDEGAMAHLAGLPHLHRDPFDRLLIAQATQHELTLVSVDSQIKGYQVAMLPEA